MSRRERETQELNDKLSEHMKIILKCTVPSEKYGRLLLASPPETRYPYVYPRDTSCAVQLFRRLVGSPAGYDAADDAFELMRSMAHFMKDVQEEDGSWGQRYHAVGEGRHIYAQEDNIAHGASIIGNYLLAAHRLEKDVPELDEFLESIRRALSHSIEKLYHKELNLFHSTTSIHESALESGYTCWVNFAFLYAFSLAHELATLYFEKNAISPAYLNFRKHFLHSVSELFMTGDRYVRRINPEGTMDLRPDFTLLSPFYFGFLHYENQMKKSVSYMEKQLNDPEFGMIMRYLPFYDDFAVHVHAGNGPWLQYTAVLAQYHFWSGNNNRGDQLLSAIDRYRNDQGEIPEHLSTCKRFEWFMEKEWDPGEDFAKEFHKPILKEDVNFNCILEEANNMARSYKETGSKCMVPDRKHPEGGYIQFALPLTWSHAEYARALLMREKDWWRSKREEPRDRK